MITKSLFGLVSTIIRPENKFYVYLYLDPRTDPPTPFYVGKGKGSRKNSHLKETKERTPNPIKYNKIGAIRSAGKEPIVIILANGLSEDFAYSIESEIIVQLGTIKSKTGPLTNIRTNTWNRTYEDQKNLDVYKKISEGWKKSWQDPSSGFNSEEYRIRMSLRSAGENNPRFGDHRNYEELHGVEKAAELREHFRTIRKGSGNSRAKQWVIVSPDGKTERIYGTLKEFCKEHNLSLYHLRGQKNEVVSYTDRKIALRKNSMLATTIGWALYEEEQYDNLCKR